MRRGGSGDRKQWEELDDPVGHGDLDALARLYDESAQPVYLMATRVVQDPRVSADVTQEVFLRVWREAGELDPARSSAWAWIYRRARVSTEHGTGG